MFILFTTILKYIFLVSFFIIIPNNSILDMNGLYLLVFELIYVVKFISVHCQLCAQKPNIFVFFIHSRFELKVFCQQKHKQDFIICYHHFNIKINRNQLYGFKTRLNLDNFYQKSTNKHFKCFINTLHIYNMILEQR